jgi:osmotically-inducible protein OsmY
MNLGKPSFIGAMLACSLAAVSAFVGHVQAQPVNSTAADAPVVTTDRTLTSEHDQVQTSAAHHYNSPAERANDDLLITEVKRSLAEQGISTGYPVAVDCDHGTIQLSGVVASADDARQAASIALNIKGVVGVKNRLTWR